MNTRTAFALLTVASLAIGAASAQTPAPIVVQAVPASGETAAPRAPAAPAASSDAVLKALQELKATNEAILKKQAATLEQLDELQKAADQIKVFSKRG
jgi:hypothetical protein